MQRENALVASAGEDQLLAGTITMDGTHLYVGTFNSNTAKAKGKGATLIKVDHVTSGGPGGVMTRVPGGSVALGHAHIAAITSDLDHLYAATYSKHEASRLLVIQKRGMKILQSIALTRKVRKSANINVNGIEAIEAIEPIRSVSCLVHSSSPTGAGYLFAGTDEKEAKLIKLTGYKPLPKAGDCTLSGWSPWGACSKTCGADGVRSRTRTVLRPATFFGKCAMQLAQRSFCLHLPCSKDPTKPLLEICPARTCRSPSPEQSKGCMNLLQAEQQAKSLATDGSSFAVEAARAVADVKGRLPYPPRAPPSP
jgi:hypothetical protein